MLLKSLLLAARFNLRENAPALGVAGARSGNAGVAGGILVAHAKAIPVQSAIPEALAIECVTNTER